MRADNFGDANSAFSSVCMEWPLQLIPFFVSEAIAVFLIKSPYHTSPKRDVEARRWICIISSVVCTMLQSVYI